MNIRERILICRVLEKMEKQESYSKKLGMENRSTFHGRPVGTIAKGAKSKFI